MGHRDGGHGVVCGLAIVEMGVYNEPPQAKERRKNQNS